MRSRPFRSLSRRRFPADPRPPSHSSSSTGQLSEILTGHQMGVDPTTWQIQRGGRFDHQMKSINKKCNTIALHWTRQEYAVFMMSYYFSSECPSPLVLWAMDLVSPGSHAPLTSPPSPPDLRAMDLVSPGSHGEHPMDIVVSSAPRGGTSSASSPAGSPRRPVEWRSLDLRAEVPEVAPSWLHSMLPDEAARESESGCMAALELIDPSDKSCISRLEHLISRKPKVRFR